MEITRGQRLKLADMGLAEQAFSVVLELASGGLSIDVACFGLDANRKLSDERYMTFFNQPATPCGAVKLSGTGRFELDLARLPAAVESLVVTLAIDGAGVMKQLGGCVAHLSAGPNAATYRFDGSHFANERAVMLLEFYRKGGLWRVSAVGQGFDGGLDALVTHFGGTVADPAPATPVPPAPQPPRTQAQPPAADVAKPTPTPTVSLSKITLEKRGERISLEKRGAVGHGRIICNLNWTAGSGGQGRKKGLLGGLFGGRESSGIDLDLGCLFEMSDGAKGAVQALGGHYGHFDRPPYIHMTGDDRTGSNSSGEFLYINGDHLGALRRVCIFAFIYEGVANWGQADGVVTLTVPGHPPIEVRLDNHDDSKNMCAIAMLENDSGNLKVTKLGEYFSGHPDLDRRYQWGLRWVEGSKD